MDYSQAAEWLRMLGLSCSGKKENNTKSRKI